MVLATVLPDDPPKKMIRLLDKYTGFGNLDDKEAAIAYYEGHIEMIKRFMRDREREKDTLVFNVREGYVILIEAFKSIEKSNSNLGFPAVSD